MMLPAIMAFVVAIAGMILPAICLTSKRVLNGMLKTDARKFAADVAKSNASSSSLSHSNGSCG